MRKIVIRPAGAAQRVDAAGPGKWILGIRTHDSSGIDFEPILALDDREARAIAGSHTGIHFLFAPPPPPVGRARRHRGEPPAPPPEPAPITIERVPDREPMTRAWRLLIGDETVTRPKDGVPVPVRLADDHVRALQELATVSFRPGPPDWELRRIEVLEDRAFELRRTVEKLELEAALARQTWSQAKTTGPDAPADPRHRALDAAIRNATGLPHLSVEEALRLGRRPAAQGAEDGLETAPDPST